MEIELVVVLGKKGKHIPEDKALDYVFGYTIGNDVSARDYQYMDVQFTRAKTMDTFTPLGPWIVTKDEIPNTQNLDLELKVNGKTWQKSNTYNQAHYHGNIIFIEYFQPIEYRCGKFSISYGVINDHNDPPADKKR